VASDRLNLREKRNAITTFTRGKMETNVKKQFVLVHGSGHGAWCWYKVVTLLESAGHRVTTLDLGASGINPTQLGREITSFSSYAQPLMEFLASLPPGERVILVGHSFGGFGISLAMESFPEKIVVAVYVTAFMPSYSIPPAALLQESFRWSKMEYLDSRILFDDGPENPPTSITFGPNYLSTNLYQHCPYEDLQLAKMLVRPAGLFLEDLGKDDLLTEENFGSVSRVFIVCDEDEVLKERFQRWMIMNSPPKEVKSIAGADHMVMLSKPKELCLSFQEIANEYN
ncbi:hypothetical protein RJ640_003787, partial [Escallonia rubra]